MVERLVFSWWAQYEITRIQRCLHRVLNLIAYRGLCGTVWFNRPPPPKKKTHMMEQSDDNALHKYGVKSAGAECIFRGVTRRGKLPYHRGTHLRRCLRIQYQTINLPHHNDLYKRRAFYDNSLYPFCEPAF